MNHFVKIITICSVLVATACSSTGDSQEVPVVDVVNEPAVATASGSDEMELALATTVFYFGFDSSELSAQDRDTLVYHANNLKENATSTIRLEGHASEEGTREYNLALGERRAQTVANFLVVNGVAASQIETVSYGEEQPAVNGSTEDARSQNRRVEIR
jgi:peptidoglycan-associated lipoprotein